VPLSSRRHYTIIRLLSQLSWCYFVRPSSVYFHNNSSKFRWPWSYARGQFALSLAVINYRHKVNRDGAAAGSWTPPVNLSRPSCLYPISRRRHRHATPQATAVAHAHDEDLRSPINLKPDKRAYAFPLNFRLRRTPNRSRQQSDWTSIWQGGQGEPPLWSDSRCSPRFV